ncbi:catechol 1,2-dioxygenase [Aquincola sp. S2]|uniref:Catechol 1,2-dioxygenase n=1 Tax=Pseudaquabacterium terrae TaxID=2732868 RepID=A0ABX2ERA3_9BURK|nr:dioxygenase [Aquabacterium terrae]NRF71166.1 catechol 1,2-dioxygenase [Aquabacterium terrae]
MSELNQKQLLELVTSVNVAPGNARVRALVARVVGDLFKTIDELDVSADEFWKAADWLSRLGTSGQVGLITAGLGFDRLLDIRADEADERAGRSGGTPRAIEGPLYVAGAPLSKVEARLDEGNSAGEVFVMEGQVRTLAGQPVAHALIDVWHANSQGGYSHFFPGLKPYELRRRIETDAKGHYRFRTALPPGYSIPPNSPTSELFEALGRHGHRPAHVHFLVAAPGQRTLTTQVNIPGDTYIDDDFAFATRDGLIVELERGVAPAGYESLGISAPFVRSRFDFVTQPAATAGEASPAARLARVQATAGRG